MCDELLSPLLKQCGHMQLRPPANVVWVIQSQCVLVRTCTKTVHSWSDHSGQTLKPGGYRVLVMWWHWGMCVPACVSQLMSHLSVPMMPITLIIQRVKRFNLCSSLEVIRFIMLCFFCILTKSACMQLWFWKILSLWIFLGAMGACFCSFTLNKTQHTMSPIKEHEGKENAQTRLLIHVCKQIPPKWRTYPQCVAVNKRKTSPLLGLLSFSHHVEKKVVKLSKWFRLASRDVTYIFLPANQFQQKSEEHFTNQRRVFEAQTHKTAFFFATKTFRFAKKKMI